MYPHEVDKPMGLPRPLVRISCDLVDKPHGLKSDKVHAALLQAGMWGKVMGMLRKARRMIGHVEKMISKCRPPGFMNIPPLPFVIGVYTIESAFWGYGQRTKAQRGLLNEHCELGQ